MHRFRKASIDSNAKQKTANRRPSANSINARMNTTQQRVRPEKSPSTQNLSLAEQKEPPNNAAEPYIPKTRFTSQDRSKDFGTSSPRLKYFPAEKIKRLKNPAPFTSDPIGAIIVQQNPHQTGTFYVPGSTDQNKGQGDGTGAAQSAVQPALQHHQNMHTTSQQQVCQQPMHQIGQMNPQSECGLHHQNSINQTHRPCVPYGQREFSPQKVPQTLYRSPENTMQMQHPMQRSPSVPVPTTSQEKNKPENGGPEYDSDGQPVGGRNATLQTAISSQQPGAQSQLSMARNLSGSNHQQPARNHYPPHARVPNYPSPQNPRQAYQQLQQTVAQQQQMQQRAMAYQMQMMPANQQTPGSQGNLYRHGGLQFVAQTPGQGMTSPQEATLRQNQNPQTYIQRNANPRNAHLKPFAINVMNPQLQFVPNPPTPQYQQLYRHPSQQLFRNPGNVNQQVAMQPDYNHPAGQIEQNSEPVNDQQNSQQKRAKLPFTASMMRDQEKMLTTMRQQGVPMEVIKRQFDLLLCEQRRQLEYIEELRRQSDSQEVRPAPMPRRRRQTDEKPEWMIHLTPSRLSYAELEKLHEERREKERLARQMEEARLQNEMSNQVNQQYQCYQPNWHSNVPQFQSNVSSAKSTPNVPTNHQQYYQQNFPRHQHAQHPHQQYSAQYQQQHPHLDQQVYDSSQHQVYRNDPSSYQTDRPTTEPSSLLKLRVYKERIRPQGRNNGLQDPEVVRRYLERASGSTDTRRGLEYLSNLTKGPKFKLNGMQDASEIEDELKQRLIVPYQPTSKRQISANGLENTRNPDNPPPQRLASLKKQQEFLREYPRQKCNPRNCYSVQAERENGTVASNDQVFLTQQQGLGYAASPFIPYNESNPGNARCSLLPFKFDGSYPQHYQQMQQYYRNARNLGRNNGDGDTGTSEKRTGVLSSAGFDRAGGDATGNVHGQPADSETAPVCGAHYSRPDLHEPRTIGGVRYLARKQDYMPNTQLVSPETLIADRHLQPPVIY
ncbi:uncharacterized protein LOC143174347 [Nomia melanderi]|uniref:uncharacterized protein LOC143174347 n=1 Tax=Nomia melanderi TaxID=2448451 RepID=UPI003FCEB01E